MGLNVWNRPHYPESTRVSETLHKASLPLICSPWKLLMLGPARSIFTKTSALHLLQSYFYSLLVYSSWPCMAPLSAHSSGQCARTILHKIPPPNLGICTEPSLIPSPFTGFWNWNQASGSLIPEAGTFRYGTGLNVLHFPLTSLQDPQHTPHTLRCF